MTLPENFDVAIGTDQPAMTNKAVFIDKDGTLIPDIPYNVDPLLISLSANAAAGLKRLQAADYLLVIITNQAGVAKGYFEEQMLEGVRIKINDLLLDHQIVLSGFYYCPHHPEGVVTGLNITCECRKPQPGMLFQAASNLHIDLSQSWMIGDILNDVEAGKQAGCRSVLIDNGNETEWIINQFRNPDFKARDLNEAAEFILHAGATTS